MPNSDLFGRKHTAYEMLWKYMDLSDYIIAAARYGGPLAFMRDSSRLIVLGRGVPAISKSEIRIYSSVGEGLLVFTWEHCKIIRFGWTHDERLAVLNEEGVYRIYDLQGDYEQFSLGNDAGEMGIIDARIHEHGLVALTGGLTLLEVKGWEGGKPLALANPGISEPPTAWTAIPPDQTISRHVEVLLSSEATIISVDTLESTDQRISRGPFTHLTASPNGKMLALLTFSGVLWVVSTDFQQSRLEFDTNSQAVEGAVEGGVRQVEWCGNDAILVTWDGLAVLVGPLGDCLRYFYPGSVHAVSEIDGVRIVSTGTCDFLEKVPAPIFSIFKPGSTSPGAVLYDACDLYERRSPKSDEHIRSIRPELASAVDECIDAASREWDPYWQRRLLNAAKFGRSFLDLYNPVDFVAMGQALKVLNAVRFYTVGIPITYIQYTHQSPSHLISRLTARALHLLALRVSTHLGLKPDAVLKHWACAKIARSKVPTASSGASASESGDNEICKLIVEKFNSLGRGDVSYADIAKRAWDVGRAGLATQLLDHESRAADQVPLLLTMKEDKLALTKAVDSGDTDLIYHVLLHLHKRLPLGNFFRLIEEGGPRLSLASRLLQVYAREQNRDMLRDFYYSDDRRLESAILALDEATGMTDGGAKVTSVKAAQKFLSEDKEHAFEAKMMDESVRLLTFQQQLEKDAPTLGPFVGLSINDTIKNCIVNGMSRKADKIKSDWKVPDKRFWYLKLQALTDMADFEALDVFAKSKRSPIGYEPFVRLLLEKGHQREAISYVARCDANRRIDLYVECDDWRSAGKECKERNNKARLEELRRTCPNTLIVRELDQIAASMA
ncbi:vacuolar protein sorting-associated protein 16 [Hysterangium stoloniferum]|nr:vacuolar protein sorting-associated protein 16 [Hysterangium stoloniferum]